MNDVSLNLNPAEQASQRALAQVYACLDKGEGFILEAGAGAGKTYTLVKALQYLVDRDRHILPKRHQKIACITFTNVAKEEVESRTDRDPLIYCDTVHGFCWSLISGFQKQIRQKLSAMPSWAEKIAEVESIGEREVEYSLGHRRITDDKVSLHHDDVLPLMVFFMESAKFRRFFASKYPIILIDEYQDTNAELINAISTYFLGKPESPLFAFFGDHWQKIYGNGCGKIEHQSLKIIGKEANFRSVQVIVNCLNKMRPELPQFVVDPNEQGQVHVFHTNDWPCSRETSSHWKGDLPAADVDIAIEKITDILVEDGWDMSAPTTKILMLTHRVLASRQGYGSLPGIFSYNESFTKKEHGHIAFFADVIEPACRAFTTRKFGEMFTALGSKVPVLKSKSDKSYWASAMVRLVALRENRTVGDVIDYLRQEGRLTLPDAVERRERELRSFDPGKDGEMPQSMKELDSFRAVPYREVIALCRYLDGHSPFETKHGVKGAQFENVLVVVGRGWNMYNFGEFLTLARYPDSVPTNKREAFKRNRNLFYVSCSRPQRRLAVLFTQLLSPDAMHTISDWFGHETVEALPY